MKTPVVLLIFNRPDLTERIFAEIARAKPSKLLVIADGPRATVAEDRVKCMSARSVIERVDWECEVLKNYSDENLGCKYRIASGLDWVFEKVEEAIILEDDCLPHPTFFRYCDELLERYRHDERIFLISGRNELGKWKEKKYSYFYGVGGEWGWASWRRAWKYYDVDGRSWNDPAAQARMKSFLKNDSYLMYFIKRRMEDVLSRGVDTWDYQWWFSRVISNGLSIIPSVNMISNIGFREDASHCFQSPKAYTAVFPMQFPLKHNDSFAIDFRYIYRERRLLRGSVGPIMKKVMAKGMEKGIRKLMGDLMQPGKWRQIYGKYF